MNLVNLYSPGNNINFSNASEPVKNSQLKFDKIDDVVCCNADLTNNFKLDEEKTGTGGVGYFTGELNGKPSNYKRTGRFLNGIETSFIEGNVGDKKFVIEQFRGKKEKKIYHFKGQYNGKEFELDYKLKNSESKSKIKNLIDDKFHKYRLSGVEITGNVNNNSINLNAPDCPVPFDEDVRDIISLLSRESCVSLGTINGKIVSTDYDMDLIDFISKREEEKREKMKKIPEKVFTVITAACSALAAAVSLLNTDMGKSFISKVTKFFRH